MSRGQEKSVLKRSQDDSGWRPITLSFSPLALFRSLFWRLDCILGQGLRRSRPTRKRPNHSRFRKNPSCGPGQTPRTGIRSPRQQVTLVGAPLRMMVIPVPFGSKPSMQIYGPFRVSTSQPTAGSERPQAKPQADGVAAKRSSSPVDQLDLSSSVTATNRLSATSSTSESSDIRVDRVADIRRQIADGSYETPEKLDAALDRLLDQIG